MSESLVSIVVPMYNASSCVSKMIGSLLLQDYANFELIIVDDCSTDDSAAVVDAFCDSRIKLFKMEKNVGPGPAKNFGIKQAAGEFIMFVDCDDYVEHNFISSLLFNMSDVDVVVSGYYQEYLNGEGNVDHIVEVLPPILNSSNFDGVTLGLLDNAKTFSFCCQKIYRADIIKDFDVCFPQKMHSEDFFFNCQYFSHVSKIVSIQEILYHYTKPVTKTLTSGYLPDFYSLIFERNKASIDLIEKIDEYKGEARAINSTIYLKHVVSALTYNCFFESGMNFISRNKFIRSVLKTPECKDAISNAKFMSKSSFVINSVMKTRCSLIIQFFVFVIYLVKNRMGFIFDKLK